VPSPPPAPLGPIPEVDPAEALLALVGSPNLCSRAWVWTQYDHMVMADTVVVPGSDAGVVRVHGTDKAIAFTSDVNPRYCRADPERGGMQAVAEAYRNLTATGAQPLAATDNLNFGSPERPEIMGQFVGCVKGIGAACAALGMPIVSGNVSLYNETEGRAILPTPTIGAVGLLHSLDALIGMAPRAGDVLLLLGETRGHLGQSALLAELWGREEVPARGQGRRAGGGSARPRGRRPRGRGGGDGAGGQGGG
jgi:phosphoribosylformylglycinamidine synthase